MEVTLENKCLCESTHCAADVPIPILGGLGAVGPAVLWDGAGEAEAQPQAAKGGIWSGHLLMGTENLKVFGIQQTPAVHDLRPLTMLHIHRQHRDIRMGKIYRM